MGIVVSIELAPIPGQDHVWLEDVVAYAAESGFALRLATWELLEGRVLSS